MPPHFVLTEAAQPFGNDARISVWEPLCQLSCQARMPHGAGDISSETSSSAKVFGWFLTMVISPFFVSVQNGVTFVPTLGSCSVWGRVEQVNREPPCLWSLTGSPGPARASSSKAVRPLLTFLKNGCTQATG